MSCVFLVTWPFIWYHNFWPRELDLEIWPNFENFNHGFSLVMVASWRALLSSDNSYQGLFVAFAYIRIEVHFFVCIGNTDGRAWVACKSLRSASQDLHMNRVLSFPNANKKSTSIFKYNVIIFLPETQHRGWGIPNLAADRTESQRSI